MMLRQFYRIQNIQDMANNFWHERCFDLEKSILKMDWNLQIFFAQIT